MDKLKLVEISWFLFLMLRSKFSNNTWFELLAYALKGRISCLAVELCWHRTLLHALIPQLREKVSQLGRVLLDRLSALPHVQFVPVLHWRGENLTGCCYHFHLWHIAVSSHYEVLGCVLQLSVVKIWCRVHSLSTFIILVVFLLATGTALTHRFPVTNLSQKSTM